MQQSAEPVYSIDVSRLGPWLASRLSAHAGQRPPEGTFILRSA
jgi:hypothetical protein